LEDKLTKGRLSQAAVDKLTAAGMYPDGDGLYLQVTGPESRSWIYRFTLRGKARWYGLGSAREITLAKARVARDEARALIRKGIDPVQERKDRDVRARVDERKAVTFRERAEQYIKAHAEGWRNEKHRDQWASTLAAYVYPSIGDLPAGSITASQVVDILRPIWTEKPETARRVRGRIEAILDYAADPDDALYRNPATMTAQLMKKLPKLSQSKRPKNHPALAYDEIGAFMASLRQQQGIAACALEFTILTAARTGETLGIQWPEIDLTSAVWTIPAERMKGFRKHRVPLSRAAVAVLGRMRTTASGRFVFPSLPNDRPLSNMAMLVVLRRMNRPGVTVHGFRSTFRTWAAELTHFPREVCEAALAHALKDKTEEAYQRGDLFEKRRRLMDDWARFCGTPRGAGEVIPLRTA
jgi:integrase